jgi:hypothetical protein
MGLPLRITFDNKDHVYHVLNTERIDNNTTQLELMLDGNKLVIEKNDKNCWVQKEGEPCPPGLVESLGRSVSLRMRM